MIKHYNITISGKVQGVWFRKSAQKEALKWGINGFVMNGNDGTVYIEAEGEEKALDLFVKWCRQGPEKARVSDLVVKQGELQNFKDFQVMR